MKVLGCETSCDETGLAVYDTEHGLLSHALFSQVDLHALYGGVVPELASRDHIRRILPLTEQVVADAGISLEELDGIAFTNGPGLAGALMTGALTARSLAWSLGRPALAVHHMEGHLLAPMLETPAPDFPFICLLVSGGHTQLVRVDGIGQYRLLGESIDDAAGEAFDKTAKMLGLPYPGGPELSRLASTGDDQIIALPRPMLGRPGLDFSFSGLKTAAITRFKAEQSRVGEMPGPVFFANLAAAFEAAVVDVLITKSRRALAQEGIERLVISGGVSANRRLRAAADALQASDGVRAYYPRLEFCTDNGAMIALVGGLRLAAGEQDDLGVAIRPRWPIAELQVPGSVEA